MAIRQLCGPARTNHLTLRQRCPRPMSARITSVTGDRGVMVGTSVRHSLCWQGNHPSVATPASQPSVAAVLGRGHLPAPHSRRNPRDPGRSAPALHRGSRPHGREPRHVKNPTPVEPFGLRCCDLYSNYGCIVDLQGPASARQGSDPRGWRSRRSVPGRRRRVPSGSGHVAGPRAQPASAGIC